MDFKPCLDCEKRTPDCHSDCIEYLFFVGQRQMANEKIRKEKESRSAAIERVDSLKRRFRKRDWRK